MTSLKKIILKNFATESGKQGITIFQHLFMIPIFINFWGINIYAEWILISVIPTYLLLGNFGLNTFGANLMVIAYNKNKKNEVNFIFKNVSYFVTIIILSFLCIFILCDYFFNFTHILNISSLTRNDIWIVVVLLILKYLLYLSALLVLTLLRAIHKFHIFNLIIITINLTELILIIITLFVGGKIIDIASVGLAVHLVGFVISYLFIKKTFGWFKIKKVKISLLFFKKIFYPSISFMVPNLSTSLIVQGTIIFIGTTLNNNLLVFYNSMRIVFNGFKQIISIYTIAHCPEILIFFTKNKFEKVVNIYKSLLKSNTFISIVSVLFLILFMKEPFLYWTKGAVEWEFNFFLLFLFACSLEWVNIPTIALPYAINKHTGLNKAHFLNFIVYWIMLLFLFDTLNLYAVPSALLISALYFLIHNFIYTKNILNIHLLKKS